MLQLQTDSRTGETYLPVPLRGRALLADALLNKGTAFTADEREAFGIRGLLPARVTTIEDQAERVYAAYKRRDTDLGRYIFLSSLQDRNETLFYHVVAKHLPEMAPIIYTPVVAEACRHWSQIYRRPRGLYLNPGDRGRVLDVLRNSIVDPAVIVVTDNERILGIGDQGTGGMGIPIGKLSLYTIGAGIHPGRCLPISLDVGTRNEDLLKDPHYLGWRRPRLEGEDYFSFVDEFVDAVRDVFPRALLQWEDFANRTSFRNLEMHRDRVPSFNDDIQGTASVSVSGLMGAMRLLGERLRDQQIVMVGAGSAGVGIARLIAQAMVEEGLAPDDARGRIWTVDSKGLVLQGREGLDAHKLEFAQDPERVGAWGVTGSVVPLRDIVRHVKPSILIGVTGRPGAFDEASVREMARHASRPVIFPLSNPTANAEAHPQDLLDWTDGRAIVATGSPFDDVVREGRRYRIGQGNNVFIFPGVGLGSIAAGARVVTDGMFLAGAQALAGCVDDELLELSSVYPRIASVRDCSLVVARAVAERAVAEGVATVGEGEIAGRLGREVWEATYVPYRPV